MAFTSQRGGDVTLARSWVLGGAALSLVACTLFWPIEDHTLRDDASVPSEAGADLDVPVSDAGADANDGATTVEVFVKGPASPKLLATNSTHLFVVGVDEQVTRIDKATRTVEALVTPKLGYSGQPFNMTGLGADEQYIFLGGNEQASCGAPAVAWKRSVLDSGTFLGVAGGCAFVPSIAHDVLDYSIAVHASFTTLHVSSLQGAGTRPIAGGLPEATAMASNPDAVYIASATAKRLVRVTKSADAGVDLATTSGSPRDIVVDATNVYWIEVEGRVASKPVGAAVTDPDMTIATEPVGLAHLAADATTLYFTNVVDGTVRRVNKTGGTVETIASSQAEPTAIAVDASGIYWLNRADSTVMRASTN
jgi:hypothetical protein